MNRNRNGGLTALKCDRAKPGRTPDGKPKASVLQDGNTLGLLVKANGTKSWVQQIVVQGKRVSRGLGAYPLISLADARRKAEDNRRIAREGGNPFIKRAPIPPFADAARAVHAIQTVAMKNERDRIKWIGEVFNHAGALANRPVDQIATADVLGVLEPIWHEIPTTAMRVRQRLSLIFQWAIVQGHRNDDPAGRALDAILPKNGKRKVEHRKALPHGDVASAIRTIRESSQNPATRLAQEFQILTAVRPNEARGARWDEIDLESRTWTVPASRMKAKREHRVPLSGRAIAVLDEARSQLDSTVQKQSGLVFPNRRGNAIYEKAMRRMMEDLNIGAVPHGFRSSFADWCEESGYPDAVCKAARAHVEADKVKAAYVRTDLFDQRRPVMQQWSEYVAP